MKLQLDGRNTDQLKILTDSGRNITQDLNVAAVHVCLQAGKPVQMCIECFVDSIDLTDVEVAEIIDRSKKFPNEKRVWSQAFGCQPAVSGGAAVPLPPERE